MLQNKQTTTKTIAGLVKSKFGIALLPVLAAFTVVLSTGLTTSCVTVNVNFPESAVQKATDDYVRDLYRAKEKGKNPVPLPEASGKTSGTLIFDFIPTAAAAEATIKVDSDKALKIKDKLASRVADVIAQKRAGVLGETNDGMLELKGAEKVKPLLKKKIESLVSAENSDRRELYSEVASSNGISQGRVKDIQKSFARSFQAESPSGTWLQDGDGKWAQKP